MGPGRGFCESGSIDHAVGPRYIGFYAKSAFENPIRQRMAAMVIAVFTMNFTGASGKLGGTSPPLTLALSP